MATLEAAHARIEPLGSIELAASKKYAKVSVLPVPGGPCQRLRVLFRAVEMAAA